MFQSWYQKVWFILICFVIGTPAALNAASYEVVEVVPAEGYTDSRVYGINNNGEVVGRYFNYNQGTGTDDNKTPFLWDSVDDTAQTLSTLGGQASTWAISDTGYVVGYSYNDQGYLRAVRWDTSNGGILDIGTFTNSSGVPGNEGFGYGVDNQGDVVGEADIPDDADDYTLYHAFLFDNGTASKTDLGTLNNNLPYYQYGFSIAYGINNQQEIVGTAFNNNYGYDPFIYDTTQGMRALPKDATYGSGEWKALAINESGVIAGFVIDSITLNHIPYYWSGSTADPVQLTLPPNFSSAEIYSVNSKGEMVGLMWGGDFINHAFVYDPANGIVELNQLIDPNSGWSLEAAIHINDAGQIVGYGTYNGAIRGFLLNPINPAVTASLSASPASITSGQSSTLTWGSTGATSCTGTNFVTGGTPSGSVSVTPKATTTYTVTCTGEDGSADADTTVTVTKDTTPPTGSIVINAGAAATKSTSATLTLTAIDDSPPIQMCISNTMACSSWAAFATTKSWNLTTGSGMKTVNVWFRDTWGNTTPSPYSASILIDKTAPTNGKVAATRGAGQITLNWSGFGDAGSGLNGYIVRYAAGSPPASCTAGTAVPGYDGVSATYIHTGLTNTTYGYRICARDKAGNTSTGATASAKPLPPETNPPTGSIVINGGAAAAKSTSVTLTLTASDESPPIQMCISNTMTCSSWAAFATTKSWKLTTGSGIKTVNVWFRDVWGNKTPSPYSASILIDKTAPTNGTVTATPGAGQITLNWSGFNDALSGLGSYKLVYSTGSAPASCSSGTPIYTGTDLSYPHTGLTSGKTYYYRVCAIDKAGNMSTGATANAKPL